MGSNEEEYEERKNREQIKRQYEENRRKEERSEYAYNQWMSGKSYDDAWDEWNNKEENK